MAEQTQRSAELRSWLQAITVIAGVGAGVYEFIVKEYLKPASAPINLTTD